MQNHNNLVPDGWNHIPSFLYPHYEDLSLLSTQYNNTMKWNDFIMTWSVRVTSTSPWNKCGAMHSAKLHFSRKERFLWFVFVKAHPTRLKKNIKLSIHISTTEAQLLTGVTAVEHNRAALEEDMQDSLRLPSQYCHTFHPPVDMFYTE